MLIYIYIYINVIFSFSLRSNMQFRIIRRQEYDHAKSLHEDFRIELHRFDIQSSTPSLSQASYSCVFSSNNSGI